MSAERVFIAIEIPSAIQDTIFQQTARLRESANASLVRWVDKGNVHLTLKFLGETPSKNIPFIEQMLTRETAPLQPFEIQIRRLGSFPNSKRPRVIWVGIQVPAALESLYQSVDSACARLGYPKEERPFSPHLTIGRVRQNLSKIDLSKISDALEATHLNSLGAATIDAAHLYKSDLKPSGPVYTKLFSAPFNK